MKSKVKKLKFLDQLIGIQLPTNIDGHAGRAIENILENAGIKINRRLGPDMIHYGIEIKTRKESSNSPQTMTSMTADHIINNSYKDSNLAKKLQQQLRIKTNDDDVIISAELYDFDQPQIQELFEAAYEHGRAIIAQEKDIGYTPYTGYWGYFEQTKKDRDGWYDFRISDHDMKKIERMAKSTFKNHFEIVV